MRQNSSYWQYENLIGTLYSVLIIGVLIYSLIFLGRNPECQCGEVLIWVGDTNSIHTSQHYFDPYSLSHFQHGLVFFFLFSIIARPRIEWAVLLESIWEFAENTPMMINRYRTATIALGYVGDSITNSVADVFCCILGFWVARVIDWRLSLAIYILVEGFMIFAYRDSLALNVIMLLYPLESIKSWQAAA